MDLYDDTVIDMFRVARTRDQLRTIPDLIAWLLQQDQPTLERRPHDGSKKTKAAEGPLPFHAHPIDAADELYGTLIDTAVDFARQLHVDPPNSALRYYYQDKNCNALPDWAHTYGPAAARRVTRDVAGWLHDWAEDIARLPGSHDYMQDLNQRVTALQGQYPTAPATKPRYRKRPCPTCGERSIRPVWLLTLEGDEQLALRCKTCDHEIEIGDLTKWVEAA